MGKWICARCFKEYDYSQASRCVVCHGRPGILGDIQSEVLQMILGCGNAFIKAELKDNEIVLTLVKEVES